MMEQCVKTWTFCFAFGKNNIEVKCTLGIISFSFLECVLQISNRRSRNTHFGLFCPPSFISLVL